MKKKTRIPIITAGVLVLIAAASMAACSAGAESDSVVNTGSSTMAVTGSGSITADTISLGDIDGDGVQDFIITEEAAKGQLWEDKYNLRWTLMLDNEAVYTDYNELMCRFRAESIDIDEDGEDEIFIQVSPRVNSMPLEEFAVLKNTGSAEGNGWKELQNSTEFNNDESNAFPIYGYAGRENPAMVDIVCEGFDNIEVIKADTTRHYQKMMDSYKDRKGSEYLYKHAEAVLSGEKYTYGQLVAETAAWGIHKLRTDNIDGHACIAATHGLGSIEGGKYDNFGNVVIYFNYDDKGRIQVIKMSMQPMDDVEVR